MSTIFSAAIGRTLKFTSIKVNDQKNSNQCVGHVVPGELYIRDLGYVTPTYLKALQQEGARFLNRLPYQVSVYASDRLMDWEHIHGTFEKTGTGILDLDVKLYEKEQLPCRLIIERVPGNVYRQRVKQAEANAKKHGTGLSRHRRLRCQYNTFITNAHREALPVEMVRKVYSLRWQIELVFKTWKSLLNINKTKKVSKERLECQLLAKLLWVLLNWRLLQSCNHQVHKQQPASGVSILKFFKRCVTFSPTLRQVVLGKASLVHWIERIFLPLVIDTACQPPTRKTTHYETLFELS